MNKKIQPIFIMGAPRSGTTMLASMIASRSDALALPEMHYVHELLKEELLFGRLDKDYVFKQLKNHDMFAGLDIVSNAGEIKTLIEADFKDTIYNILNIYNEKYFDKDYKYWVEHSPHNHEYYEVLLHCFPDARFIHIVRDGRAVYSSTKETDWGYKDVITGAVNWKNNVEHCLILSKIFPQNVLTVRYEDLTMNPEKNTNVLCEFLGIDFQKSMLDSKGIRKPRYAKYTNDLGRRPNTKSQDKWRYLLQKFEVGHFTSINERLLTYFGYEVNGCFGREIQGYEKYYHKIIGLLKSIYYSRQARKRFGKIHNDKGV